MRWKAKFREGGRTSSSEKNFSGGVVVVVVVVERVALEISQKNSRASISLDSLSGFRSSLARTRRSSPSHEGRILDVPLTSPQQSGRCVERRNWDAG